MMAYYLKKHLDERRRLKEHADDELQRLKEHAEEERRRLKEHADGLASRLSESEKQLGCRNAEISNLRNEVNLLREEMRFQNGKVLQLSSSVEQLRYTNMELQRVVQEKDADISSLMEKVQLLSDDAGKLCYDLLKLSEEKESLTNEVKGKQSLVD
ncbi:hypothetical protein CBR_g31788 [Chara braunii]|uniref:Uncharacterized protein n=1 Tax=Chara braunii TaxID=69332 RepID=A0A388LFZ8_CHABU|nr:hypothetical protein CBR_g31788 [Chara braunii]|eukprot:GBG81112.1 hypothetical protein CBR_g31788 [Chara braunii]